MTSVHTPARLPALAERTGHLADSAIGAVLRLTGTSDVIPLAAGSPAPETFCSQEFTEVTTRLLKRDPAALQYGDASGLPALRSWIAAQVPTATGRSYEADRVLLTHGSQQALDLLCKALLDPGDVVVVDRPSYLGALQVFRLFQARVVDVPISSDHGLERLGEVLASEPRTKMIYVVPAFANPTGTSLTAPRRERLSELAERYECVLVEDDPYRELGYDPAALPLPAAPPSENTVRMGSFSKVLFPGARLGYVIAPPSLIDVLMKFKQAADLGNSHLLQQVVHDLVQDSTFLAAQLDRARGVYRERRDALVSALAGAFGSVLDFEVPRGGFFVWGRFPQGTDTARLLTAALKEGVSYVPGTDFYATDPDRATLRLSFSCARAEDMPEAVERLARAWHDSSEDRRE
ncbi:PLP-dependent aminotransferase family protein [Streptomyces sp. CoH27]|uniref:aminotransferase-like domain-containing protein n=1 Tax=Streptomyces sp. CoH27 TaxID=2875763 RepID=UPI001CD67D44|nr:PLP-dependent aminotransferase family protein [Streptomyces sp. CoH27]